MAMGIDRASMTPRVPTLPPAPSSIQKGTPLKHLLGQEAIGCLAQNIQYVDPDFPASRFCESALVGIEPLAIMQRGLHIAKALQAFLPGNYEEAVQVLMASLTPEKSEAEEMGLAGFFYLPHSFFVSEYGQDDQHNGGNDPFETSMLALHALTMRFTSEFAIRTFLIQQQERTLEQVDQWLTDPNPHVRRLCSEGTRPRLPWGKRIASFVADSRPTWPIRESLKDDPSLYVRRSVANHLGDIAKDHPDLVYTTFERWLQDGASTDLQWLIRHAVRYPAKQGDARARKIRAAAS
ncbi:DNA alkylation repair protein [Synechococcus sp. BA-132 BA5]|uniref:DNA alkylation repair protein n=1 Tax=Synechococcus sp. BA-132 BA5 TaxID=3110252 RepID=UPI002B21FADC|nr:DNA alkylation repair protein [Synechococcus sp. BA-132 BA5]MEA5414041.1 DNA alkylation repair protein [Synechococcus sp. BA-132 BA5]